MATPGIGLNATAQSSLTNLVEQKLRAERVVKAGASWFLMVGSLSLINSVLAMSGSGIRFIFGLGIAQFVDALARQPETLTDVDTVVIRSHAVSDTTLADALRAAGVETHVIGDAVAARLVDRAVMDGRRAGLAV